MHSKPESEIIHKAETHFLSGDFQESLLLCNRFLSNSTTRDVSLAENEIEFLLETPLELQCDPTQKTRQIKVRVQDEDFCNEKSTPIMDRAAAVALQSWYEIARTVVSKKSARGYIHLLPFLKVYSTTLHEDSSVDENFAHPCRPMLLDLAVVFVHFLRTEACGHNQEAIELSGEILVRFAGKTKRDADCLEELFCLLVVEFLPYCTSQIMVVNLLQRIQQPMWKPRNSNKNNSKSIITREQPNSDVILTILSFLNRMPPKWSQMRFPSLECIGQCQNSLQSLLKSVEQQHRQLSLSPHSKGRQYAVEESLLDGFHIRSGCRERLTMLEDEGAVVQVNESSPGGLFAQPLEEREGLLGTLMKVSNNFGAIVQKCKEKKGSLAFLVFIVLLTWRKRRRAASLSAGAIRMFLAPFQEVVDALMSPA